MNKRELELIYMDYLEEINQPPIDEKFEYTKKFEHTINKDKILEKFKQPLPEVKKVETQEIKEGQIYLFFKNNIPIFFTVIDKIDNLYEALKISNYFELANQNDLITDINGDTYIVEVWNTFYLTEDEIKNSIFYGVLPKEDLKIVKDYKEGKISELPKDKRGMTIPINNKNYFQAKFHQQESRLVREYKLRPLLMEEEEEIVLEIPPEREVEIQLPLVAGKRKTLTRTDKFLIRTDEENNILEIIFVPQLKGKKAKIKFFDEELEIESLPEKIYIEPSEDVKNIDLEKLKQKIKVQVE